MEYIHRHLKLRLDPRELLAGARSIIVTALQYHQSEDSRLRDTTTGHVAQYAWGRDYHKVVKRMLFALADQLREQVPEPFDAKACVDTAPLLEREAAAAAGIGWIGKNTMVLNSRLGSYFFLGALVTTLDLHADDPVDDHCGRCTACLDACPTQAFPSPYEMDASKCISYLTIEHRSEIPDSLQPLMGDWLFGCDVCQEVCPFNRHAPLTHVEAFSPGPLGTNPDVKEVTSWTVDDYRERLRGSAGKRATLQMWQRNAAIVAANAGSTPSPGNRESERRPTK